MHRSLDAKSQQQNNQQYFLSRHSQNMPPEPNSPTRFRWQEDGTADELHQVAPKPKVLSTVLEEDTPRTRSSDVVIPISPKTNRAKPFPNTILDRQALEQALDNAGIIVKPRKIDYFYEHLHRQNYPPLPAFVSRTRPSWPSIPRFPTMIPFPSLVHRGEVPSLVGQTRGTLFIIVTRDTNFPLISWTFWRIPTVGSSPPHLKSLEKRRVPVETRAKSSLHFTMVFL